MQLQKEAIYTQAVKKGAALKSCEIKGSGQQMAAMMLMLINFNNTLRIISIESLVYNTCNWDYFLGKHTDSYIFSLATPSIVT